MSPGQERHADLEGEDVADRSENGHGHRHADDAEWLATDQ